MFSQRFFLSLLPALFSSILVTLTLVTVVVVTGGPMIESLTYNGVDTSQAANLVQLLQVAVPLISLLLFVTLAVIHAGLTKLKWFFWPRVGSDPVPKHRKEGLLEGLDGQKELVERSTSWPSHVAQAKSAKSAARLQFGDARFSTPASDLRAISKFVGRPRRRNSVQGLGENVLIITGEPGAGKSVLTQEMHASLVGGVRDENQYLIPIIVFASDLTLESLGTNETNAPKLKDFLVSYFRTVGSPAYDELADFVEIYWAQHDFLVIVDGLDEIAQRSAYVLIQRQLRQMIERELHDEARRVRRFVLSCRTEDDMTIFPEARGIELRGLRTERARRRFCENIIRANNLSITQRSLLRKALERNSRSLSSVDIFRRNPYFLALLLEFFRRRLPDNVRVIDFNQLIVSYIAREIERPQAFAFKLDGAPSQNREELRRSLERGAGIFLQFLAFHMTTAEGEEALYGNFEISADVIDGFIGALASPCTEAAEGPWPHVVELLDRLEHGQPLSDEELSKHLREAYLDENDLRILERLAQMRHAEPKEIILGAFSVIAHERRVEAPEWYSALAQGIVDVAARHFDDPRLRLAIALLARGLVAAHVLRLVNIDVADGLLRARFRHRRLAEYYAACYFRDRWAELKHLGASPWLTPVLNLVSAIEGERCLAMRWFIERIATTNDAAAFSWRKKVTDAAEVAAFAHRGPTYQVLLTQMAETFLAMLKDVRRQISRPEANEPKRDLVTQLTIINALDFLGGLDVPDIEVQPIIRRSFEAQQLAEPSHLNLYTAKAANAIRQLTAVRAPAKYALIVLANAVRDPTSILGHPAKAFRYGIGAQWILCVGYVTLVEALLCGLVWHLAGLLAAAGMAEGAGSSASTIRQILGALAGAGVAILRIQSWYRNPTRAAWLSVLPFFALLALGYTVYFSIVWLFRITNALPRLWHHVGRYSPIAFRRLVWLINPGLSLLFSKLMRSVPAIFRFLGRAIPAGLIIAIVAVCGYGLIALWIYLVPPATDRPVLTPTVVARPTIEEATKAANCEQAQAARTRLSEIRPISDKALDLARARREVSRLSHALARANADSDCIPFAPKLEDQTLAEATIDELLNRNPLLVPYPTDEAPEFGAVDFARIESMVAARPSIPTSESLFTAFDSLAGLMEVSSVKANLSNEIARISAARRSGRITDRPDQAYPAADRFAAFAQSTAILIGKAEERRQELEGAEGTLRDQIWRASLSWAGVLFLAALVLWLLRNEYARRKDMHIFARARGQSLASLCETLKRTDLSDRLRQRLRIVLARRDVQQDEIALVEEVVQVLSDRKNGKDLKFAVDLGSTVTDLANRLAR